MTNKRIRFTVWGISAPGSIEDHRVKLGTVSIAPELTELQVIHALKGSNLIPRFSPARIYLVTQTHDGIRVSIRATDDLVYLLKAV